MPIETIICKLRSNIWKFAIDISLSLYVTNNKGSYSCTNKVTKPHNANLVYYIKLNSIFIAFDRDKVTQNVTYSCLMSLVLETLLLFLVIISEHLERSHIDSNIGKFSFSVSVVFKQSVFVKIKTAVHFWRLLIIIFGSEKLDLFFKML